MGICRYCQKNAGWFSDAHDACVQKANAEREFAKKALDSFQTARPRTAVRALSFAGGDPLYQRLTKKGEQMAQTCAIACFLPAGKY
jgi:organic radical activating enzyme